MPERFALSTIRACLYLALSLSAGAARAQDATREEPEEDVPEIDPAAIELGDWTLYPHLQLFIRGEVRNAPVDRAFRPSAVQSDTLRGAVLPLPPDDNQWVVRERARLGLGVGYGPVRGVLTLQDARALGEPEPDGDVVGAAALPTTAPYEAYIDVSAADEIAMSLRLGRQEVVWGSGRLIGRNDRSATGRSLDAARAGVVISDFEAELLAALLEPPGAIPADTGGATVDAVSGTGTQLYGLRGAYHFLPWLSAEAVVLARIVRPPFPDTLTPGDTYVVDGRLFGDHRGFRYEVEAAGQLGRIATVTENRDVGAFALAGLVELETALLWHLTFGLHGAYASGNGNPTAPTDTQTRFDPILPESHDNHGQMGLYAWSNLIEVGGSIRARPVDEVTMLARYAFVGLAEAQDRWTTAALIPVGADPANSSSTIGHNAELDVTWVPWSPLAFGASYGILILGDGGKNILEASGLGRPGASHWGMLDARLTFP